MIGDGALDDDASVFLPVTAKIIEGCDGSLEGLNILHINHDLRDVRRLNRLLVDAGCRSTYVPIPYSVRVPLTDQPNDWRDSFLIEISDTLKDLKHNVAVLEDGGYAVQAALREDFGHRIEFAIEQTRFGSGIARAAMAEGRLPFPVISCSRSTVKCRVESQFLAIRLADVLADYLIQLGEFLSGKKIVLVGYGIIGRPLSLRLRSAYGCALSIVDTNPYVAEVARGDGFDAFENVEDSLAHEASVVVGASGRVALGWDVLRGLCGRSNGPIVLASVSSGDVEFGHAIREGLASGELSSEDLRSRDWGTSIESSAINLRVLADGRPINFFRHGSISLADKAADLVNARLVEALIWQVNHGNLGTGSLSHWSTAIVEEGDWRSDIAFLATFCELAGLTSAGDDPLQALRTVGLYDLHPAESILSLEATP